MKSNKSVTLGIVSELIKERFRQQDDEGWTWEHDDKHDGGELAMAASAYAYNSSYEDEFYADGVKYPDPNFPWDSEWWKPTDKRRDLIKAGALIIAEIERIDRKASREEDPCNE